MRISPFVLVTLLFTPECMAALGDDRPLLLQVGTLLVAVRNGLEFGKCGALVAQSIDRRIVLLDDQQLGKRHALSVARPRPACCIQR